MAQSTHHRFQSLDPLTKAHGLVSHVRNQMKVVGHDDESASKPTVAGRAIEKERCEALECVFIVEDAGAAFDAYRQEVGNVSVAVGPDLMKTAEATGW
jgi:hypothetical protein